MRNKLAMLGGLTLALGGCVSGTALSTDLSARPITSNDTEQALINALADSYSGEGAGVRFVEKPTDMQVRRYIDAGFALTDIYCDRFFRETNQSMRRRKFGRALTNDVGTAMGAVLGVITTVPKAVVSGATAITGGLDSTWRNYDDAFVVAPELQNVRALVLAAQDQFREKTYEIYAVKEDRNYAVREDRNEADARNYMSARSTIIRYAGLCTFLGMQSLLSESIGQQREFLLRSAAPTPTPTPTPSQSPSPAGSPSADPAEQPVDRTIEPAARAGVIPIG